MIHFTSPACEACRKPLSLESAFGTMHRSCLDRILARTRRPERKETMLKRAAILTLVLASAGCGGAASTDATRPAEEPIVAVLETSTTTIAPPTTTTTMAPTTTTTVCVPVDTTAQQTYLATLQSAIDQTASGMDGIQLVIDNGTRSRDAAARYAAAVQENYNDADAAFRALPSDTNADKLAYQKRRLADANDVVASWNATMTKARSDLARARAQKADFERKARTVSAEMTAAQSACQD